MKTRKQVRIRLTKDKVTRVLPVQVQPVKVVLLQEGESAVGKRCSCLEIRRQFSIFSSTKRTFASLAIWLYLALPSFQPPIARLT